MTDVDLSRLRFEVKRAVENAGVMIEQLNPGLVVKWTDDLTGLDVYEGLDATEPIATVPRYRLELVDVELIGPATAAAIRAHFPTNEADQLLAHFRTVGARVSAPSDADVIFVTIGDTHAAIHRSVVVSTWPEETP